jgi:hypothetical protein
VLDGHLHSCSKPIGHNARGEMVGLSDCRAGSLNVWGFVSHKSNLLRGVVCKQATCRKAGSDAACGMAQTSWLQRRGTLRSPPDAGEGEGEGEGRRRFCAGRPVASLVAILFHWKSPRVRMLLRVPSVERFTFGSRLDVMSAHPPMERV